MNGRSIPAQIIPQINLIKPCTLLIYNILNSTKRLYNRMLYIICLESYFNISQMRLLVAFLMFAILNYNCIKLASFANVINCKF